MPRDPLKRNRNCRAIDGRTLLGRRISVLFGAYQDALGYPTDAPTLEAARRAAELGAMAEQARARFGGGEVAATELVSLENLAARAVAPASPPGAARGLLAAM